jgi:hypothetical protein
VLLLFGAFRNAAALREYAWKVKVNMIEHLNPSQRTYCLVPHSHACQKALMTQMG